MSKWVDEGKKEGGPVREGQKSEERGRTSWGDGGEVRGQIWGGGEDKKK